MSSFRHHHVPHTHLTWVSCWRKCSRLTSRATDKLLREVHVIIIIIIIFVMYFCIPDSDIFFCVLYGFAEVCTSFKAAHISVVAPDVAALALSGDWAAEFVSGPDTASAPGLSALGDAADADWTREFIAEAAGSLSLL